MNTKYFIETYGPKPDHLSAAVEMAIQIAHKDKEITGIVLYSYTKNNFMQVCEVFGEQNVQKMFKGPIRISNISVPFMCKTEQTYNPSSDDKHIVVGCHLDANALYKLDDIPSAKYIIAIPWLPENTEPWIKRWNAIEFDVDGKIKNAQTTSTEKNTILRTALICMDNAMLNTKCLSHKSDEEECKTYVRAIFKYIPDASKEEIENILVTELQWKSVNAQEVGILFEKLKQGKKFNGGSTRNLKQIYENWGKN